MLFWYLFLHLSGHSWSHSCSFCSVTMAELRCCRVLLGVLQCKAQLSQQTEIKLQAHHRGRTNLSDLHAVDRCSASDAFLIGIARRPIKSWTSTPVSVSSSEWIGLLETATLTLTFCFPRAGQTIDSRLNDGGRPLRWWPPRPRKPAPSSSPCPGSTSSTTATSTTDIHATSGNQRAYCRARLASPNVIVGLFDVRVCSYSAWRPKSSFYQCS